MGNSVRFLAKRPRSVLQFSRSDVPEPPLATNTMPITLPRRDKAAAKVGPRLEISPLDLKNQMQDVHGLSAILCAAESWEPFAWKGNDLSAPLRALYVAESRGLLQRRADRAVDVLIADITADINGYLQSFGKNPVSENSVLSNLRTAALYLNAALGVSLVPDRKAMTVRIVDGYETAENIERYFRQIEGKISKLNQQVEHARNCGYEDLVSHVLSSSQMDGVKLLAAKN